MMRPLVMLTNPTPDTPQLVVTVNGNVQRFELTKDQLSMLNYQSARILWEWNGSAPDEK